MRVALACVGSCLALAGGAAPTRVHAQTGCAIEGTLGSVEIVVRRPRGLRRVRLDVPTRVSVVPLRGGIAEVRALDAEGVEGTTRAPLRFALGRAIAVRGIVELPRGLPVERVHAAPHGGWVEVDAALGDGLHLVRVPLPCDALVVHDGASPSLEPLPGEAEWTGPRWSARTSRLHLFDRAQGEQALRCDVAPGATVRFVEIERRGAWARVGAGTSLGVRVHAWVLAQDLRAPEAQRTP